ncbi:MAG TPA: STAS domain-containing protein [Burkholderiales bacterium]|nr:STAS domain-containing protein [Burkholderiales bacterium]
MIDFADGRYCLRGPVTLANVGQLMEDGRRRFDGSSVRVDLSGVTEADSSAIGLLLGWAREAAARGATIQFENPTENLETLIGLYQVGEFLPRIRR